MKVKSGDVVSVDYEGKLDDGKIFDSSHHGDHSHPLSFEAGSGQVIKGFDDAVIGMEKGEEKEFKIKSENAYGDYKKELTRDVPREMFPPEQELKDGMILVMQTPEGQKIPINIVKVTKETVTIDLNHPLAGKNLTFKIKVVGINEEIEEHSHD